MIATYIYINSVHMHKETYGSGVYIYEYIEFTVHMVIMYYLALASSEMIPFCTINFSLVSKIVNYLFIFRLSFKAQI